MNKPITKIRSSTNPIRNPFDFNQLAIFSSKVLPLCDSVILYIQNIGGDMQRASWMSPFSIQRPFSLNQNYPWLGP
jgi:hypothetical protein